MKQEFEKAKPIEFTAAAGSAEPFYHIHRADIKSVQAAPKTDPGNTIIHLKICERHPEGGRLSVDDELEIVIRRLNGLPDEETVREWEEGILQERVIALQNQKAALLSKYPVDEARQERGYQKIFEDLSARDAQIRSSLDVCARRVGASPRLKLAVWLQDYADRFALDSKRAKVISVAAQAIGGNGWEHVDHIAQNKDVPNSIEKIEVSIRADLVMARERLKQNFETKLAELDELLGDPHMTADDNAALARQIEEYRRSHAEPDYTFVRDPASHSYRPKAVIEQERKAGRSPRTQDGGPFSAPLFGHER